jgi:hypothetical protein
MSGCSNVGHAHESVHELGVLFIFSDGVFWSSSFFYSTVQEATKMGTKANGYEGWKEL